MAALTGGFLNKTNNNIPEFYIKADDTSSQMLLFQIYNSFYGNPFVLDGTIVPGANLASELLFSFGGKSSIVTLDNNVNINNISIVAQWNPDEYVISSISNYYEYDSMPKPDKQTRVLSRRNKLFFNIKDYNLIKDFSPKIIVERYVSSKTRGTSKKGYPGQRSGAAFRTVPRSQPIPITSNLVEIDFTQEELFRVNGDYNINAKAYKSYSKRGAHVYLQFRIQLKINDKVLLTNPLLKLKLQASLQYISIESSKLDEIRHEAVTKKKAAELEIRQIKNEIELETSDTEIEALQKELEKKLYEIDYNEALIDATKGKRIPDNGGNPQFDGRYFAISYRMT